MHTFRTFAACLLLLLSVWLGGACSTDAAPAAAATAAPARPAAGSPDRILFIIASSTVHGTSTLPASISFGEVVHARDVFNAAGYAVDMVSPDGGAVPILDDYVSPDVAARLHDARIMDPLRTTFTPAQVDAARYRAVYYVGGSNAMYGVPEHPALQRIALQVYEGNGGVVSAVCHGTAGIVNLRLASGGYLIAGKRVSGFPEEHEQQGAAYFKQFPFLIGTTVRARGGVFRAVDGEAPHIQVDGRLVTGQNYASAAPVARAVVAALGPPAHRLPQRAAPN
ncbi:type 1 glutamine amidotransferase domain-containing protein [Stenotrophomonas rhizophila]